MTAVTLVIDTSVIIKWLSGDKEDHLEKADRILLDTQDGKVMMIAPELAKYEVGNVLIFSKKLSPQQAALALKQLFALPIKFIVESEELARETYDLAFEERVTYYDASFMSLAKQYDAVLITENPKHQGKSTKIKTIPLADYLLY